MGAIPSCFDLDRLILALSDAFDLVGVDKTGHSRRVGLVAARIAEELGWENGEVRSLLRAALLHDCGVSTTGEHHDLMGALRWADSVEHAARGAGYLAAVPELAPLAPLVAEHHTAWTNLCHRGVAGDVALAANLICLADRTDALLQGGATAGRELVAALRGHGGFFAPQALAALDRLARCEAFWFALDEPVLSEALARLMAAGEPVLLDTKAVVRLAAVVGGIIDRKSPYTECHSGGVAKVSVLLGKALGLGEATLRGLEIAGYLHDIGKLRIPDELLNRQGALDAAERLRMARHAFDTRVILTHAFGPGGVADWASFHHECLSGNGYPFHLREGDLCLEARIVAVADVFQALAQYRPYRAPLTTDEIAALMDGMVFAGKLDAQVVAACKERMGECWNMATGG
ncbi:HD-GYP domain-containing protein [Paramagnetospirillum caucaseum]|nr:HD domain-containing phosphohydrolase [Paramagnetospirillum caucaseum]